MGLVVSGNGSFDRGLPGVGVLGHFSTINLSLGGCSGSLDFEGGLGFSTNCSLDTVWAGGSFDTLSLFVGGAEETVDGLGFFTGIMIVLSEEEEEELLEELDVELLEELLELQLLAFGEGLLLRLVTTPLEGALARDLWLQSFWLSSAESLTKWLPTSMSG